MEKEIQIKPVVVGGRLLKDANDYAQEGIPIPQPESKFRQLPHDLMASRVAARPRVYGNFMYTSSLSLLGGVGGVGKSLMIIELGISLAIGRDLIGFAGDYDLKACPVLVLNNEDDYPEIELRVRAIIRALKLSGEEFDLLRKNFHYRSGLHDKLRLCATQDSGEVATTETLAEIETFCQEKKVEALFADPLVSLHDVEENSNTAMEVVLRHLREMFSRMGIAACIAHHTKKGSEDTSPDEQLRGATAIVNASRVVKVLSRMSAKMAKGFDLEGEERTRYIYAADGKQNYGLPADSYMWFYLKSVGFDAWDGEEEVTEFVGVPMPHEMTSTKPEDAPVKYTAEITAFLDEESWPITISNYYSKLGAFINPQKPVSDRAVRGHVECFPLVNDDNKSRMETVAVGSTLYRCWREKKSKTSPITLHRERLAGQN